MWWLSRHGSPGSTRWNRRLGWQIWNVVVKRIIRIGGHLNPPFDRVQRVLQHLQLLLLHFLHRHNHLRAGLFALNLIPMLLFQIIS